jgi:hypothetical protein
VLGVAPVVGKSPVGATFVPLGKRSEPEPGIGLDFLLVVVAAVVMAGAVPRLLVADKDGDAIGKVVPISTVTGEVLMEMVVGPATTRVPASGSPVGDETELASVKDSAIVSLGARRNRARPPSPTRG